MCKKRILILGASDFQMPAIIKAKEMGLFVGVVDINPTAVGISYADKYYQVSTIDEDGVIKAAADFHADGVFTLCTDMPMRALAHACETLGLIGLDLTSAMKATDKAEMIRAFELHNIPHPQYWVVARDHKREIDYSTMHYPVITKPTDNSGSRGLMCASNQDELNRAIDYSSSFGRNGSVIIEEYMRGPEVSVELLVINGIPNVLQITDKLTTQAPHFVEIGHSEPSQLRKYEKEKIIKLACDAALSVGIKNGAGHAEIILTDEGPKMVEIGARMGGGCITTHLVPLSTGIDMTKAAIQLSLGETPSIAPKFNKGAAIRFIIPPAGEVISISGVDEAKNVKGVQVVEVQCKVGQVLTELENGTSRIGYVIAQANSAEEAIERCEEALKQIKIHVKNK